MRFEGEVLPAKGFVGALHGEPVFPKQIPQRERAEIGTVFVDEVPDGEFA